MPFGFVIQQREVQTLVTTDAVGGGERSIQRSLPAHLTNHLATLNRGDDILTESYMPIWGFDSEINFILLFYIIICLLGEYKSRARNEVKKANII